ncbi:glycoside hydrolase family 5 protein, partial [Hydnum rufescens UP504]
MHKLFHKLGDKLDKIVSKDTPSSFAPDDIWASPSISEHDIYRYRKQRGINLGSWFTLERWIAESPFCNTRPNCASDLDVARAQDARRILETHWDSWITEGDWQWLSAHGFNTVRIPIGYYHVCGVEPDVLKGTDFAPYGDIYQGAWSRIVNAIKNGRPKHNSFPLDLHAAPGAQNRDAHSGTGTGQVHFWEQSNREATVLVLKVLAAYLHGIANVVGLELMNEPANNDKLQAWYESTIEEVRRASAPPDFPLYVGDAWDGNWYSQWTGKRPDFIVMDHHLYRCFTPGDAQLTGDQHAAIMRDRTKQDLSELSRKAGGNVIVGEWSGALGPSSLGGGNAGEQDRQRRVFVRAQMDAYEATCAGSFWWTYKKGHGWDAGWCARDAVLADIIPKWVGRKRGEEIKDVPEDTKGHALREAMLAAHTNYWGAHGMPNGETWRFEDGFSVGWDDAWLFIQAIPRCSTVSELGFRQRWMKRRASEHAKTRGSGPQLWEFDHGFEQGYNAAL